MVNLSVNINKFATLRNARGGNTPNVLNAALNCERFGAQGITVHPRPDERHIRYKDVFEIAPKITTEFNIEGNPVEKFMELVLKVKPDQVTLVPDSEDVLTSNAGWNTKKHQNYLTEIISEFKNNGIRTSIFLDPDINMVESAAKTGTDRIELYTESYATLFNKNPKQAIEPYKETAILAKEFGLGINAGHDLNLDNIEFFIQEIPFTLEVSIGHALISESIYLGLENVIQLYLKNIKKAYK